MMKRFVCLLSALLMLTTCALAEEYVTIAELREQAKAGWNETYQTKNGEQVVNAQMGWFPTDAQVCPLLTFESISMEEDDPRLDKWREQADSSIILRPDRICISVDNEKGIHLDRDYHGELLYEDVRYYDGEIPLEAPEGSDIGYEDFLTLYYDDLKEMTGLGERDIHIDNVKITGARYKAKKQNGETVRGEMYTSRGGYHLHAYQLIRDIPVLGAYLVDKGYMNYTYYRMDNRNFGFICVKEKEILEEDLPLLSFEAFTGKLGEMIEAGRLSEIGGMRFGYGTCKDGDTYKVVPIWRIECKYSGDRRETLLSFNAQTGEILERYAIHAREESLRMPKKILTWDDVN